MSGVDPKILARIKKCLRLAASDNAHEAATALRQAQALMREHSVSDDDLALSDIGEVSVSSGYSSKPSRWNGGLINAVANTFGCEPMFVWRGGSGTTQVTFIGAGAAAEVAGYAYTVLLRQCKRDRAMFYAKTRGRRANRLARADQFAEGWVMAVVRMLEGRHQPKPPALIASYMAKHHSNTSTHEPKQRQPRSRNVANNDRYAGMQAGRDAELHDALGGASKARRLGHAS